MFIENSLVQSMDWNGIIKVFAVQKARKKLHSSNTKTVKLYLTLYA